MTHIYVLICVYHKYWFLIYTSVLTIHCTTIFTCIVQQSPSGADVLGSLTTAERAAYVIFDWRMTISADVALIGPILFSFDLEWIETLVFHRNCTKYFKHITSSTTDIFGTKKEQKRCIQHLPGLHGTALSYDTFAHRLAMLYHVQGREPNDVDDQTTPQQ